MKKWSKQHLAAFHKAQEEVREALRPYLAHCTGQYFEERDAIETFVVYSKEPDAFEGRHHLRGLVTVWYGRPICKDENCPVNIALDSHMVGCGAGTFEETLAKAIPALSPEAAVA